MNPYYDADGVTIYHGDALDVLPQLDSESFDAVVTDPPYKLSQEYSSNADPDNLLAVSSIWATAPEMYRAAKSGALCAMFYDTRILPLALETMGRAGWKYLRALTLYRAWGVAHKLAGWMSKSDFILLFAKPGAAYHFHAEWKPDTYIRKGPDEVNYGHPAQKPIEAVSHLIRNVTPPGGRLLDPYLGIGTTTSLGREAGLSVVGIEVEERYCKTAVQRLGQNVASKLMQQALIQ